MIRVLQVRLDNPKSRDKQIISLVHILNDDQTLYTCYLIERPWLNNRKMESCIPLGVYPLKKRRAGENGSRIGHDHLEVMNVYNRSGIKWHIANYVRDLLGCGAPGLVIRDLDRDGLIDVSQSRAALEDILGILPDECILTIIKE